MSATIDSLQEENTDKIIEFPLRLRSDLTEFDVSPNMHIRRMDDEMKHRLLFITNTKYDERGRLIECTNLRGSLIANPEIRNILELNSSNYVLAVHSMREAIDFNLAMKLTGVSCSSLYYGYTRRGAIYYVNPPCYYGHDPLNVRNAEVNRLSQLVALIDQRRSDNRFKIMSDIYSRALSLDLREESRFIEITIILDVLLLPSASTELSYRFSLRLAKLMNKLFDEPVKDNFEWAQKVYRTRSKLVHTGADKELDNVSPYAHRYAQLLLAAYLDNKESFNESSLDAICLG